MTENTNDPAEATKTKADIVAEVWRSAEYQSQLVKRKQAINALELERKHVAEQLKSDRIEHDQAKAVIAAEADELKARIAMETGEAQAVLDEIRAEIAKLVAKIEER